MMELHRYKMRYGDCIVCPPGDTGVVDRLTENMFRYHSFEHLYRPCPMEKGRILQENICGIGVLERIKEEGGAFLRELESRVLEACREIDEYMIPYGEIVWDYYFNVIPSSSSLRFYGENAYEGDKADKQAVGEWIYGEVYGYDGEKIDPRFALPSSFLQMPSYSEEYLSRLEGDDAEEAAEELLAFYYDYGEDGYSGAYVDAFVNFQGQEAYASLYSYCSKVIYYKGLPSYLGAPLLCFVLLPLCLRGRSVGKLAFRLQVVDAGGGKARWYQLLAHYGYIAVCFMLMGLPIGSFMGFVLTCLALLVDFIVLLLSKKRRSLHDMIAHTEVLTAVAKEQGEGGGSDELSSNLMQAKEELSGEPSEEGEVPLREKD